MRSLHSLVDDALDALAGRRFDPRMVKGSVIDTGEAAWRARGIAHRLNAVRAGRPKEPVVLWTAGFAAVTLRGPWIYVAKSLMERLSDDGLAFVLAHEMAHHDLRHLNPALIMAGFLGHSPRMELLADAEAFRLCKAARFGPNGGLETFAETLWEGEAHEERDTESPFGVQSWVDRLRTTHPPMPVRRAALERLVETS